MVEGCRRLVQKPVQSTVARLSEVGSEGGSTDSRGRLQDRTRAAVEFLMEKAAHGQPYPRCRTSFLFIAVLVTWIVFLFVSPAIILRVASRLALLLLSGIAYRYSEFIQRQGYCGT